MAWSQFCGPSCDSWILDSSDARLRRPGALASGRTLSFCRRGFFLGHLFGLGLVGRVRASVPTFFWWYSHSLVLVFAWWLCRLVVQAPAIFLDLTLGSSLSLPMLADGLRWLRFILGCPPSVASLWRLLPWFLVRYLLACPHGAAVPLDSWVLWCS